MATAPGRDLLAAIRWLLRASSHARADDVATMIDEVAPHLGLRRITVYVVDYDQVLLIPLPKGDDPKIEGPPPPLATPTPEGLPEPDSPLPVEGTVAGRAFTDVSVQTSTGTSGPEDGFSIWAPVLDGTDRLGVLELALDHPVEIDAELHEDVVSFASFVAELLTSRSLIGDRIERTRRRLPMLLEAELQWKLLPPLTFASPRVSIAGVLAPTNEVAGDSFDYAVNGDIAHLCILDAMGHGMDAMLMSAVAVGAFRNGRRSGLDLLDTSRSMNKHLAAQFGESRFVTAILGELDLRTGTWRWITAGHPAALLVRGSQVVKRLDSVVNPPLGLQHEPPTIGEERLERGDRLLLYTDGVPEARDEKGEFFGTDRLVDLVSREAAAGRPAAETMRRLNLAILSHQEGMLQDDATTVMVEWAGDDVRRASP